MYKKQLLFLIVLFILSLLLSASAIAQNRQEPINHQKDKMDYQGYTIRLMPADGGGYGFAIFKEKQPFVHQGYNPFTMSPWGLAKRPTPIK